MIISHKYKFIFIKTVKTAGTSIEVFLSDICGDEDIITPIYPHIDPHRARNYSGLWNPLPEIIDTYGNSIKRTSRDFIKREKYWNHIPATLAQSRTPKDIWNSYFKFCVERNPWDKTLSHYHMINDRSGGNKTLDDYFDEGNFCVNFKNYTDKNKKNLMDKVVKYESLSSDLNLIFHKLGIPFDGSLNIQAKSSHRKDRSPYKDIFSKKQKETIDKLFKDEIEMHNYKF